MTASYQPSDVNRCTTKLSLGILLSDHLQEYDSLRKSRGGFLNRLRLAILKKAFPQELRGHIVAADTLVDAILRHGAIEKCELFVFPWSKSSGTEKLNVFRRQPNRLMKLDVTVLDEFVKRGVNQHRLSAWFNPLPSRSIPGGIEVSQRIRRSYFDCVYPITTLLHGLSAHWMQYDCFLRIILEGTYPCDSLICTSRASREATQKMLENIQETFNREFKAQINYQGRVDLIPLCVDTVRFRPQEKPNVRRLLRLPRDGFIILFLGRLSLLKADLHPFLQVLRSLVADNPKRQILWVIAGTEEKGYTESLKNHARELGVSQHIRVILNPSDDKKELLLPAADVFISPTDSLQESFGLTPLEAMACGVPQVVPDWNGYRDTVQHGQTGFLVPTYFAPYHDDLKDTGAILGWGFDHFYLGQSVAADIDKTREYLQCLIRNDELRAGMGRQSRQRAISTYSYEVVVRQYEELWRELAAIAIPLEKKSSDFDRMPYGKFFGHYATHLLRDDTPIQITVLGSEVLHESSRLGKAFGQQSYAEFPDGSILKEVLAELAAGRPGRVQTEVVTLREVLGSLTSNNAHHTDRLRRHIMWLIKSGCIKPSVAMGRPGVAPARP